jgi:hypothetical protein
MLASSCLQHVAASVFFGTTDALYDHLVAQAISKMDTTEYADKRIVLKGCGDVPVPESAYVAATFLLQPLVKSIMYGEPCSTVPVYKKARTA